MGRKKKYFRLRKKIYRIVKKGLRNKFLFNTSLCFVQILAVLFNGSKKVTSLVVKFGRLGDSTSLGALLAHKAFIQRRKHSFLELILSQLISKNDYEGVMRILKNSCFSKDSHRLRLLRLRACIALGNTEELSLLLKGVEKFKSLSRWDLSFIIRNCLVFLDVDQVPRLDQLQSFVNLSDQDRLKYYACCGNLDEEISIQGTLEDSLENLQQYKSQIDNVFVTDIDFFLSEDRSMGCYKRIEDLLASSARQGGVTLVTYFGYSSICSKIKKQYLNKGILLVRLLDLTRNLSFSQVDRPLVHFGFKQPKYSRVEEELFFKLFHIALEEIQPKKVIYEYVWSYFLWTNEVPGRKIIDTHDVMFDREIKFREQGRLMGVNPGKEIELQALAKFDEVLTISGRDEMILLNEGVTKVRTLMYLPESQLALAHSKPIDEKVRILFVGGPQLPNREGIKWFANNVMPLLPKNIELNIAGTVGDSQMELGRVDNINVLGFVSNLDLLYESASIVIAPLFFGSGLKIKVIEALSRGKTVVSTDVGAEGLEFFYNRGIFIANDTYEFARVIKELALNRSVETEQVLDQYNEFRQKSLCEFFNI